jgi:hypothetical protein
VPLASEHPACSGRQAAHGAMQVGWSGSLLLLPCARLRVSRGCTASECCVCNQALPHVTHSVTLHCSVANCAIRLVAYAGITGCLHTCLFMGPMNMATRAGQLRDACVGSCLLRCSFDVCGSCLQISAARYGCRQKQLIFTKGASCQVRSYRFVRNGSTR